MIGNKFAAEELALSFKKNVSKIKEINKLNYEKIKKEASANLWEDFKAEDFILEKEDEAKDPYSSKIDSQITNLSDDKKAESKCNMCGYAHDGNHACDSVGSYAKDKSKKEAVCKSCKSKKCKCSKADSLTNNSWSRNSYQAADHTLDHDKKSQHIVSELSKIAKSLNKKGRTKEAKVLANAALDIKSESIANKVASDRILSLVDEKAKFVNKELTKIARDLRNTGNSFAADMVDVTNEDISREAFLAAANKARVVSELVKMARESYSEGDIMSSDIINATILNIKRGK